ncbi:DegT/DnrJ/EryC1/StrS family aminotransferase [Actinoplanes sp. NPDC049802]|uniref:DegT/DnrJ/EryC1/StrS family aminotransferase n=1 Tax=Actinoplanes sp. NPDC049802 TaxID=3154742 RepID=UPI00340A19B3
MATTINVMQPELGEAELAAVREVFESRWIGRGPRTARFERMFAEHLGADPGQVTSTSTCTEATFIAVQLLGLGPGDEVVMPTVHFVGAANAVAASGARPVFCDVDPHTLNPSAEDVAACLTPATRAVLVLHYAGHPGDIAAIADLCRRRGLPLIEDAANAVASRVDGQACGTFGDIGVWSFDHGKIAVSVDGGMLWARDPALAERAARLAFLGMEQRSGFDQAMRVATRWWDFDVSSFSRRAVLNDVLAAIGCVQLERLGAFVRRRREVAARYDAALAEVKAVRLPPRPPAGHEHSHFLYAVQMDPSVRDRVARELYENGIYTTFRYPLLHEVAAYGSGVRLPRAEHAAAATLCLPQHQGLSDADVDSVAAALTDALATAPAL